MSLSIDPRTYQALAIRKAAQVYRDHKVKVNSAYTPTNMRLAAAKITGEPVKTLDDAISALERWLDERKPS